MSASDLLRTVLVHQRRIFLAVLIVFMVVAAVGLSLLPKRYDASASLFVGQDRPVSASGSVQRDDVLAKSYAELLKSPAVADKAAAAVGGGLSRQQLLARMSFLVTPGTQLIAVTGSAADPRRAAQLANGYARTFVHERRLNDARSRTARLGGLTGDIRIVQQRIKALNAGSRDPTLLSESAAQLRSLRATYQALDESLVLEGSNLSLATEAVPPVDAAAPNPKLYLGAALILALLLAAAAALLRDRVDRRVWDQDEVLSVVKAPVLARIPKGKLDADRAVSDAFDFLATNLRARTEPRTILVTSPSSADGKTTVVKGLARSLTATGDTVIAADCDFRMHKLSDAYRGVASAGLEDVAAGLAAPEQCFVVGEVPNLTVAVTNAEGSAWRVDRGAAEHLVRSLAEHARFVVFDTAPVTGVVETSLLAAAKVDAVVLVVDLHTTRRDALVAAVDQLVRTGTPLEGVVINRVRRTTSYGYGGAEPRPAFRRADRRVVTGP